MRATDISGNDDFVFEALTPLGFRVRVSHAYWSLIVAVKHPVMAGRQKQVKEVLENPEQIRLSRSDPFVYLFYRPVRKRQWICAVAKRLDGKGFLITAYLTDAIKEGVPVWPK
jgi:hypothetical protein